LSDARSPVVDALTGDFVATPIYDRAKLAPGDLITGPALIAEAETTTLVTRSFNATINGFGHIVLTRRLA
jgi:N-methylhydantoinase A